MKILVTGSSGLVGTALAAALRADRQTVVPLVRSNRPLAAGEARWEPISGQLDAGAAEAADAVVNLAGASIAGGRWNAARKQLLRSSRIEATRNLVTALSRLARPPKVFVSASAIGYFGNRGDEQLTEQSAPGDDFLAQLARDWEAEALRGENIGMRVVVLRFGVVLAAHGGALAKMLPPFRMGLGGRMGSGRQWVSWLTLAEAVALVRSALQDATWRGTYNAVAPHALTNAEFTRVLGRVLRRPTLFPVPSFALRLALGEMADALLLSSQRVLPKRLENAGYQFRDPSLEGGLRVVLERAA
jgi:uncharacterized protein (TIGR01777 family)